MFRMAELSDAALLSELYKKNGISRSPDQIKPRINEHVVSEDGSEFGTITLWEKPWCTIHAYGGFELKKHLMELSLKNRQNVAVLQKDNKVADPDFLRLGFQYFDWKATKINLPNDIQTVLGLHGVFYRWTSHIIAGVR